MLGKQTLLKRINLEHRPELTLRDVLVLFEIYQQKIKQENKTREKFEFGVVNRTRHVVTVKYTLNLKGIYCEARRIDSWLEHLTIERYFHEQRSEMECNRKGVRNTLQNLSSYDAGPLLQGCPDRLKPHVRSAVDIIVKMSKQHTGK